MPTKILVLPLVERYWLLHVWKGSQQSAAPPPAWNTGATLGDKAGLLLKNVQHKALTKFDQQWQAAKDAPAGSLNNRLYQLAQYVLSRVDPTETFLKAIPRHPNSLTVTYPEGMREALVRRRLRLLAARRQPYHRQRFFAWCAAMVPQIPIIPLPLPNVTIYYTIWRIMSHQSANTGARVLSECLNLLDAVQRYRLACQLQQLVLEGRQLAPGEWPAQLLQQRGSLEARLLEAGLDIHALQQQHPQQQQQQQQQQLPTSSADAAQPAAAAADAAQATATSSDHSSSSASSSSSSSTPHDSKKPGHVAVLPVFQADAALASALGRIERCGRPVSEDVIQQVATLYDQPSLLEHYQAALRVCLKTEPPGQQAAESSSSSSAGATGEGRRTSRGSNQPA